jgi:tetratricopeptide (TPR) repeat protein
MEVGRFAILPGRLVALSERARALSRTAGVACDAAMTAAILFQDGRAKLYSSHYGEAHAIFDEIRQLGQANHSEAIESKPASAFGMNLCCQGLFNETLAFINEGNIGCHKASGNFIDYLAGLGWIAYASCQTGQVADGLRLAHLAVHEAEQVQSPIYLSGAHVWRSHALMAVRQLDEAVADARRCVALSQAHAVPYLGWHGLVFLALCLCRQGDYDAATAALAQARELLAQVEDRRWSLLDYLPAIEAEIACDEALTVATAAGGHFAAAMAWRVKALVAIGSGAELHEAQACFDRATGLHEQGGAAAERCFSALVWAHALHKAGHGAAALRWVQQAQALAQRHGYALERCEHGAAAVLDPGAPAGR